MNTVWIKLAENAEVVEVGIETATGMVGMGEAEYAEAPKKTTAKKAEDAK